MSRPPALALAKPSNFIWRRGAFLTNSFPRIFESVGLHSIEGVSCVGESLRGEMLFQLMHKIVTVRIICKINCYAALIIGRIRGRGAKVTAAQPAQSWQGRPAKLIHHGCFAARGRKK